MMFTETTEDGKKNAPIQAPALNSTVWGGLAAAVTSIGAAVAGLFTTIDVKEWQVRVTIVACVALVIIAGLVGLVVLIHNDAKIRLTAAAGKDTAEAGGTEEGVVWITPPPMHVYSVANPKTQLHVILVGVAKDKVRYYAAEKDRSPVMLTAQDVHHVEIGEHSFSP